MEAIAEEKTRETLLLKEEDVQENLVGFLLDKHSDCLNGRSLVMSLAGYPWFKVENQIIDFKNTNERARKLFMSIEATKNSSLHFEKCIFIGGMQFRGVDLERISFKHCQFIDPRLSTIESPKSLSFANCVLRRVKFEKCLFENPIEIVESKVSEIEIDSVRSDFIYLSSLGYCSACKLAVSNHSGGDIILHPEKPLLEITSDWVSAGYFQGRRQQISVS